MTLTGSIVAVTPNPRNDSVSSIQITFNKIVHGVTVSDFALTRAGSNVPLTTQTISGSGSSYFLNGLTPVTHQAGAYVLTLNAAGSGIVADDGSGDPLSNSPSTGWTAQLLPWDGVQTCFRSAHLFHQSALPFANGGALIPFTITSINIVSGQYVVTLSAPLPADQDWTDGDYVAIEQQSGAPTCTGTWAIQNVVTTVTNTTFKLVGPVLGTNATGGKAVRWHAGRWDSICSFTVSSAAKRGNQNGTTNIWQNDLNFLVPHDLTDGIYKVTGAVKGLDYGFLSKVRLTVAAHPFLTGNVVEVAGVRVSDGSEIARGWWVVTKIGADEFDLDGSIWPSVAYLADTGIVRLNTSAVANRASLLSGDLTNGAAPAITSLLNVAPSIRGYAQALNDFRAWFEAHTRNKQPGHYFSASAVGTPHAVLERGINAGYPMILTPLNKDFTNGWEVATSQSFSGNLELSIAAGKTPPAAWAGKVRVALFGHSNPSYCLDQHLDKVDTSPSGGGTGLRRLHGFTSAATSGSATQLTDTTQPTPTTPFPNWLVGFQLYMETGPNAGLSRTIKSVSSHTITVDPAFPNAIAATNVYRAGHLSFPVASVSGQAIRLATPYRAANGAGGAAMFMGKLATSGNSIVKGGSFVGGDYTRVTMEVDHGLAVGNYVVVLGTSNAAYNCRRSTLVDGSGDVRVHKVVAVISATSVDVDTPYVGTTATGGRWYGTCLTLLPFTNAGSTSETADEGRIDTPDTRHPDVRTLFGAKLRTLINEAFLRHGPRHIGLLDECAFRHSTSAASNLAIQGSYAGETTDEIIDRVGELGDWLRSEWCRQLTANTSAFLTKDTFSAAQRTEVISRWGGLMSEGACFLYDRSVHQMKGPDGYLDHLTAMLSGGARYYYSPQEIDGGGGVGIVGILSTSADATRLRLKTNGDSGLFPTAAEGGGAHNHSGSLIGIYGHPVAALNGVHRVRRRDQVGADPFVTLETRWFSGMTSASTATLVYCHFATPLKITAISNNGAGKTRVTTELPHNIPAASDENTAVRIFGYAPGIPDNAVHAATRVNATQFDLPNVAYSANAATGICFYSRADLWHWLGLSHILWQPGKALEYSSTLNLPVNTRRAYLPAGMSPDGAFAVTGFDGEADSTDGALPKRVLRNSTANFTDAVLGEQLLSTSGNNNTEWRRIIARTSTTLTVDIDFPNNILAGGQVRRRQDSDHRSNEGASIDPQLQRKHAEGRGLSAAMRRQLCWILRS